MRDADYGYARLYLFQSAPGREAGRCGCSFDLCMFCAHCFNPRPAVRPGDALDWAEQWPELQVSIRARP